MVVGRAEGVARGSDAPIGKHAPMLVGAMCFLGAAVLVRTGLCRGLAVAHFYDHRVSLSDVVLAQQRWGRFVGTRLFLGLTAASAVNHLQE